MDKASHLLAVPKPIELSRFWHFDFGTGFGTAVDAEEPFVGRDEEPVPEAYVFGTASILTLTHQIILIYTHIKYR